MLAGNLFRWDAVDILQLENLELGCCKSLGGLLRRLHDTLLLHAQRYNAWMVTAYQQRSINTGSIVLNRFGGTIAHK